MIKFILLNIILAGSQIVFANANMKVRNYDYLSSRNYFETVSECLQSEFKGIIFLEIVNFFKESPNKSAAVSYIKTNFFEFTRWNIQNSFFESDNVRNRFLFFQTGVSPPKFASLLIF